MKLKGQAILITRDVSQSGSLKEILEESGARVISVPTIKITEPPDWQLFDNAIERVDQFNWVVFTSINAVKKTYERMNTLGRISEFPDGVKLAAVGDQTARAAEAVGWKIDLVPSFFQAEGLIEVFKKQNLESNRFWFPRALTARNKLIKELEKSGVDVTLTPVYQNVPPLENRDRLNEVLVNEQLDWITFTSSSTVTNFFAILGRTLTMEELPKLASIGTITTRTLVNYGLAPTFTADPQNIKGLCQGILDW